MTEREMGRREFMKVTGGAIGAAMIAGPGAVFAAAKPGARVDPMKITTATAAFDPVRPEVARVCAGAFKQIGWDVQIIVDGVRLNVPADLLEGPGTYPGYLRSDRIKGRGCGCNLHGIDFRSRFGRSEDSARACDHGGPDSPPGYLHKLASSYFSFIHHKPPYCKMIACGQLVIAAKVFI